MTSAQSFILQTTFLSSGAATLAGRSNKTITLVDNTSNANNDIYKDFCFSWNYDGWGGLTESHTPGCGLYEYAYDARGREVLMSNSLMSPSGTTTYRLRYTVYDGCDRVSAVRYVNSTSKLSVLRSLTRGSTASTLPTTVTSKFTTLCTALTREYFPFSSFTYPNSGALVFVADAGVVAATDVNKTKVKGMLKCETVYPAPNADGTAPSSSSPTLSRGYHYDSKGRTIQLIESYSDNHAVRYSTKYNFAGKVLVNKETHYGAVSTYITTTYTRDNRGRTLSVARNVDGTAMASVTYGYDELGNMTSDGRKGLVFSYNVCNLPREVTSGASGSLTYTYLSDGTKVSAIKSDGSGERYIGSFVYTVPSSGSETLESAAWDEGRISFTKSGSTYTKTDLWFVKDHLGNVRTVVDVSTGLSAPQVVERNDYLPFGTRMNAGTAVLASNRFRLGNKENQIFGSLDLGKVDFGARMYDPFTAGWTTADPLAAKYGSISPYSYCGGNPIRRFDNNGMDWWEIDETGRVVNSGNSKDCDSFYMVKKGEDGSYVRTGVSIDLNYQSVLSHRAIDYSPRQKSGSSNDPKIDTYDVFKIRGDNNGTRLFEFLADNITKQTGVEISHAKTGLSGNKGLNFISFGHAMPKEINNQRIASEFSMSYLLEGQLLHGYTIRELNHSHPFSNEASLNDNNFAQKVKSYLLQEKYSIPSFNVYYVKDKAYYPFGM